jgi:ATP-dependent RNA helicase DeaD
VRAVVLDEADEMLDFGFKEDLEFILQAAPHSRRTLMFSATVSKPIADLARSYQRDAVRVSTAGQTGQHADITYRAHAVAGHEREAAVINVLRYYDAPRALVFCATRQAVNTLTVKLQSAGFSAVSLSGELTQAERTKALDALRDGRAKVCVATDVAARGIDLPGLDLVVHAEPPTNAESLQHRSGRTGRAGAKGVSVFVVGASRKGRVIRMLREAGIEADWSEAPGAEAVRARDTERLAGLPALSEALSPERLAEAQALIERFGAERVAAAFLDERQARLPAVHSLSPAPTAPGKAAKAERNARRDRADFDDGDWLEINLGRKQRAEPRWLVPLICRIGDVTGADIGSIRIEDVTTRFQIAEDKREAFLVSTRRPRDHDQNVRIAPAGQAGSAGETQARPPRPAPEPRADDAPARTKRKPRAGKAERQAMKAGKPAREARPARDWAPKAKPAGAGAKLKRVKKRGS